MFHDGTFTPFVNITVNEDFFGHTYCSTLYLSAIFFFIPYKFDITIFINIKALEFWIL